MSLYNKPLDTIEEADLQALVGTEPESKQIEHKRTLPNLKIDEAKLEFLKDASSFANSMGGDIIYGVEADKGVPTAVTGIAITFRRRRQRDTKHRKCDSGVDSTEYCCPVPICSTEQR